MRKIIILISVGVASLLLVSSSYAARWLPNSVTFERGGYRLELFAQKKIATRAFIQNRGFSTKDSLFYSSQFCVFGSAQGNILTRKADPSLEINLAKWRVLYQGKSLPLVTRQDWEAIWKERGVEEGLRTSFYWTLFPTLQKYSPTDYNWGGIVVKLPAGAKFDLQLWWRLGSTEHHAVIKGLSCRN